MTVLCFLLDLRTISPRYPADWSRWVISTRQTNYSMSLCGSTDMFFLDFVLFYDISLYFGTRACYSSWISMLWLAKGMRRISVRMRLRCFEIWIGGPTIFGGPRRPPRSPKGWAAPMIIPLFKSFTISAWTTACIIGFNLRCGSLLSVASLLRWMRCWTMVRLNPFISVIIQPMASLCFLRIALRSSSFPSFTWEAMMTERSLVRLDRRNWDVQVRLSILRKRKAYWKD